MITSGGAEKFCPQLGRIIDAELKAAFQAGAYRQHLYRKQLVQGTEERTGQYRNHAAQDGTVHVRPVSAVQTEQVFQLDGIFITAAHRVGAKPGGKKKLIIFIAAHGNMGIAYI